MKNLFKKLSNPQTEVEDLDSGYDSEYYAGSYDKADRRDNRAESGRYDERGYNEQPRDGYRPEAGRYNEQPRDSYRPEAGRFDERRYDERPVEDNRYGYNERRYDERPVEDNRYGHNERDDGYYAPRGGLYVEEDAPAYRERVEEAAEPVFTPEPAPEYLYYTPATYRDCREGIVKGLAAGHVVVVRLGDLAAGDVLRLFDYMMGAVLALDAELVRPEATTVVLVPDGVELDEDELELDGDEPDEDDDEEYEEDEEEYEEDEEYEEEYDEDAEYDEDEEYDEEEYDEEEEYEEYADEDEYEDVE